MRPSSLDRGYTLAEVLVAMSLAAIVTLMLLLGVNAVHRGQRYSDQDSDTLGSLRTAVDRIEKDLRQARKIYTSTSPSNTATVWIDYNRDFVEDTNERVVWSLTTSGGNVQLTRSTVANPTPTVIVRNLVQSNWFSFNPGQTEAGIALRANSAGTSGPERHVQTEVRLRNAQTR